MRNFTRGVTLFLSVGMALTVMGGVSAAAGAPVGSVGTSATAPHAASQSSALAAPKAPRTAWSSIYIEKVIAVKETKGSGKYTYRIYPTDLLRSEPASTLLRQNAWSDAITWASKNLRMNIPNTRLMRDQFFCHIDFVRSIDPNKTSWNIVEGRKTCRPWGGMGI